MTGFGASGCGVQVRYDNAGIFANLPDNDARAAALLDGGGNGAPVTVTFTPDKKMSAPVSAHWSPQLAHAKLCHPVHCAHQCTAAALTTMLSADSRRSTCTTIWTTTTRTTGGMHCRLCVAAVLYGGVCMVLMHVMRLRMCHWCHCRYVRSLDSKQLGGKNSTSGACEPVQYLGDNGKNNSLPNQGRVNPCGLIAYSNFNDTFAVSVGGRAQTIDVSCWRQRAAHATALRPRCSYLQCRSVS